MIPDGRSTDPPPDGGNPWRKLSSREVYANAWIPVREDKVVRPHGRARASTAWSTCAPWRSPSSRPSRTATSSSWESTDTPATRGPGRSPKAGATWRSTRRRRSSGSFREDTGLEAGTLTRLGTAHTSNSVTTETSLLHLAEDLVHHDPDPEGTEELRLWRLPLDEALAMALDGRLTDSLSVIGLARAVAVLGAGGTRT